MSLRGAVPIASVCLLPLCLGCARPARRARRHPGAAPDEAVAVEAPRTDDKAAAPSTGSVPPSRASRGAASDASPPERETASARPSAGPSAPTSAGGPAESERSGAETAEAAATLPEPPEDAEALAAMLPEKPAGFGRPVTDRAAWLELAKHKAFRDEIARAERLLKEPLPDSPDDLYLDFSRTGNRTRWQRVASRRRGRIRHLVMAECLEDKGRFLPAFEELVRALCAENTWVMPAHDRSLANFNRKRIDIDLGSAHLGAELATAVYLLGDRLGEETRRLVTENVERRILVPFRGMAGGKRRPNWWMNGTNNWNAVCLAGVTCAAMALVDSREDRAFFIEAAARHSKSFLKGFTGDGYCSEGVGYWNYGFGNYVVLTEAVMQATGGRVDLLSRASARAPALFAFRIEIAPGVCPAFADCGVTSRPSSRALWYVNRRLRLGRRPHAEVGVSSSGHLYEAMMWSFPNSASRVPPAKEASAEALLRQGYEGRPSFVAPKERSRTGPGIRTWFDEAGILIARPHADTDCRLAVALKGGHNAEHHNHNDVGSYVAVVGRRPVLLDPGGEVYTARTFSGRRYESNVLNSFGHPVPRVAGKLQRKGKDARARVVRAEFTDRTDTLVLDIKAAYGVPELASLRRTFVYSREGEGSLTVTDEVEFGRPQRFGTALVTLGSWKETEPGILTIHDFDEAVQVVIDSAGGDPPPPPLRAAGHRSAGAEPRRGGELEIRAEEIKEDVRTKSLPVRIGLEFRAPVTKASVTVKITPVAFGKSAGGGLLRNGGFELDEFGWDIPRGGMGEITDERAASGRCSLRIADGEKAKGSNVTSARAPVRGKGAYELRGKVYPVSGNGIGMYVRYYSRDGRDITEKDARGYIASLGTLGGTDGRWKPFKFRFEPPAETAFVDVWIHSYNASEVVAYLDDLEIVPASR